MSKIALARDGALGCAVALCVGSMFVTLAASARADDPTPLASVRRIVFLGDSITYAGEYIEDAEALARLSRPGLNCEFINLGLPSETASGLSEPGHADGKFPRPDVHERLERALEQTKPDLLVVCYGMNDGIYHPLSDERFAKFQNGIRRVRERATAAGAKVVHLTPPPFDPLPIKDRTLPAGLFEYRQPFEGYDEVLERYSQWLLEQRSAGWDVVDVHGPLKAFLVARRTRDPSFCLAGDGVHLDAKGHWLIAQQLLAHWKLADDNVSQADSAALAAAKYPHGADVLKLVAERQQLQKDAWLAAVGHKRPGMNPGQPLAEAQAHADQIEAKLREWLAPGP